MTGRLRAVLARRFGFTSAGNVVAATLVACVACGLVSLLLGQDSNWDLRNYHLYNAWAVLDGRLATDLAPAQLQSYFVPWLDVPYYLLAVHGSPLLAGVVMACVQGLGFVLVAGIAWQVLEGHPGRATLAPLFGVAGCCSAVFLSELGGTMADSTTALLVLGALGTVLGLAQRPAVWGAGRMAVAGVLLGLAMGLKLTNAIYALGLGVAILAMGPAPMRVRMGNAALLTASTTLIFAAVAGPWFWRVWQQFGNPLFPQFNAWFDAPLANGIAVADLRWQPQGVMEFLAWPFLFTLRPELASDSAMPQVAWALLYLLFICLGIFLLLRRRGGRAWRTLDDTSGWNSAGRMLLVFVAVSFMAWLLVFGIHRYLAAVEMLAPLAVFVLALRVLPAPIAKPVARLGVIACVAVALLGWNTWGHSGWGRTGFEVDAPPMDDVSHASVLLVGTEPQAWMLPFLPAPAAYAAVASNFPESPAYARRVEAMVAMRGGPVYALFPAETDRQQARAQRLQWRLERFGMTRSGCGWLRRLAEHNGFALQVEGAGAGMRCHLRPMYGQLQDVPAMNRALVAQADARLHRYGWTLDAAACGVFDAWIGDVVYPFHWCELTHRPRANGNGLKAD